MNTARIAGAVLVMAVGIAALAGPAEAGSHLWKINEVFSSDDGTIQFIELHECCGAAGEIYLTNLLFTSKATGKRFRFPETLRGSTANRYLLLGTAAFAALPGAPRPDYIIAPEFFSTTGDTLWYSEQRNYDRFVFGTGDLPTDGRTSIQVTDFRLDRFTTGKNSPTNYRGETGSVELMDALFQRGDCNDDGKMDLSDPISLLSALFLTSAEISCTDACDANDDGEIDISDPVAMLVFLFLSTRPLPAPEVCGADATTEDPLNCRAFSGCP
ncbi:MAG: hypothetical protein O7J95_06335 [Planctomycetota bacterium]|nr:hypothetical protein [Planctomycetota bacterium]